MALHSSNLSRRSDDENAPPTPRMSKIRGGIQGASRRRRARSAGGHYHPRYAVKQAKHKSTVKDTSMISLDLGRRVEVNTPTSSISMTSCTFPRYLFRPSFRQFDKEKITAVAPELADTELMYIREGLRCLGPEMLKVLAGVKAETASNVLPKELSVIVNDISSDPPTHMMALYSRHVPPSAKRRVTLFPIHGIVLATHCANLPALPASIITRPEVTGSEVSMPIVPLCIPAPEVFPQLSTFLYTKRIDHLLASLLPCPIPHILYSGDPESDRVLRLLHKVAGKIATTFSAQTLLTHALAVNGLWRSVCALGIDDKELWCALDVAWEILVIALAVSTGKQL